MGILDDPKPYIKKPLLAGQSNYKHNEPKQCIEIQSFSPDLVANPARSEAPSFNKCYFLQNDLHQPEKNQHKA